jgi:hypothetical protein
LLVEQLLEIIFTFFTVKFEPAPEDAPPADALLPLGELAALESLLLPITRTWWPTCSVNFEVSPARVQALPD